MDVRTADFLRELRGVAAEVAAALARRQAGQAGEGAVVEFRAILAELGDLEGRLVAGSPLPDGNRRLGAAWFVTDTWPFDSALGARILDLESRYQHLPDPARRASGGGGG